MKLYIKIAFTFFNILSQITWMSAETECQQKRVETHLRVRLLGM